MVIPEMIKRWEDKASRTLLVAVDVEAGGLNDATHEDHDRIPAPMIGAQFYPLLEITAKFFNGNYQEIAEPITFIINHSLEELHDKCFSWSINQFQDSLFLECAKSDHSVAEAEKAILQKIQALNFDTNYILGNSVSLDRSYIKHQMPALAKHLHYRLYDVSTLKTMFDLDFGEVASFNKTEQHRTEGDISETMKELAFYRKNFIKTRDEVARDQLQ